MRGPWAERGLRRVEHTLLVASLALVTAGLVLDVVWLAGIGAWTLIGSVLMELNLRR